MAELAPLSILITADADDLKAELAAAKTALKNFETQAGKGTSKAKGLGAGLTSLGNVSKETRYKIQMTSLQLQDIIVQLQMGTKVSTTLAQQLPQLAGAFGAAGAAVGILAGVGIPALSAAFSALGGNAVDLEDAMKALDTAMGDFDSSAEVALTSLDKLREKYGENAEAVRELYQALVAVNQQQAINAMGDSIAAAADEISDLRNALGDFSEARRELAQAQDMSDVLGLGVLPSELARMEDAVAAAAQNLQDEFGLTSAQAYRIVDALNAVESAAGPDQAALAAEQLSLAISSAAAEGAQLDGVMNNVASSAARAYAAFSEAMQKGNEVAAEMAGQSIGSGWTFGGASDLPPAASMQSEKDKLKSSSGGSKKTNPLISELEQLQQSLMTQEELQLASYERQQDTLQSALEQRLITQQEYAALMEDAQQAHADKMEKIDVYRYGSTGAKMEAFMGDMASALSTGNEKMQKISQAFAASEALINAWRAYSQTLAQPGLSYWEKIPAALSILSAGIGAVNAIKSVGSNGSGSTSASSTSTSTSATSASAASAANVNIDLTGTLDKTQLQSLTEQLNSEYEDGYRLNFV